MQKKKHFAAWFSASKMLTTFESKMDVAEESNRYRLMYKAFNTMKMNVGICVLINLLDLKRAQAMLKNTFLIWRSRTQLKVCMHGGLEKAILYNKLRILGRAFWAWENTTKAILQRLMQRHSIQQGKKRAIKAWHGFAVSVAHIEVKSGCSRLLPCAQIANIPWELEGLGKGSTKGRSSSAFLRPTQLDSVVYIDGTDLSIRGKYRLRKEKATLQFFYIIFRRWNEVMNEAGKNDLQSFLQQLAERRKACNTYFNRASEILRIVHKPT